MDASYLRQTYKCTHAHTNTHTYIHRERGRYTFSTATDSLAGLPIFSPFLLDFLPCMQESGMDVGTQKGGERERERERERRGIEVCSQEP